MRNLRLTLLLISVSAISVFAQQPIDADNDKIVYWGRVDHSNPKAPAFEFSGVTIKAQFTGTSISATLNDFASHGETTTNYYYKIIDGGIPEKFEALAGTHTYELASSLATGSHAIELIKLTEASVGKTAFLGFTIDDDASLEQLENHPECSIEFIGNSITCGYGNEENIASNPNTGFHSINENNYEAWGYITARNLGMEYKAVSYSGRGMYRNNTGSTNGTLPKIYDRIYPDLSTSPSWNHEADHPNIIVINLGTNDFALDPATPLNETTYKNTYINFVNTLLSHHPNATIICATGVMMSDFYPSGATHWTRITTYVQDVVDSLSSLGNDKVHYFQMNPQSSPYGEDWHPSKGTHNSMATSLTSFINNLESTCDSDAFEYTISNWFNKKRAAVALTFDDFSAGHPGIVVPEMNERKIPATFFVSTSTVANWNQVQLAFDAGHEIASHSKTHPDLTTLSAAQISDEIRGAKELLEQQITGLKVLTFAYPFGSVNAQVKDSIVATEHIAARGVHTITDFSYDFASASSDYLDINTTSISDQVTLPSYLAKAQSAISGGGFVNYLYHSVFSETVDDNNYAKIHQDDFEAQLDGLLALDDEIWMSTFAQAVQYHHEKKTAELNETSAPFNDGNTWKLQLTDDLKDDLYFQALTIGLRMPSTVNNILSISQNTHLLEFSIDGSFLWFNAVPDAGEIIINISNCEVPEIGFISNSSINFCTPTTTTLSVSHAGGNTYEWFKNGESIGNGNPDGTIAISDAGEYTINITNNNCTARSAILGKSVTLINTGNCGEPKANFESNLETAVIDQVITLTNLTENAETNATYEWRFDETVVINGNQTNNYLGAGPVQVQFMTSGEKQIELYVSGSVASDSITKSIVVVESLGCIFEDHFESTNSSSFLGGWNNYNFSVSGSKLIVTTSIQGANEWHSFTVLFNNGTSSHMEDFSVIPKTAHIKFRVRASDTLSLKVSFIDANGKVADGTALGAKNVFDVTTEYQVFDLDVTSLFFNQWDDIELDSTQITGIDFRINSGYTSFPTTNSFGQAVNGPFVGILDIDWIGVNGNCELPDVIDAVTPHSAPSLQLYPNPAFDTLYLETDLSDTRWRISSISGRIIKSGTTKTIDISTLSSGMYLFSINGLTKNFFVE